LYIYFLSQEIVQDIAEQKIAQVMFYTISSSLLPEVLVYCVAELVAFPKGLFTP
jgi:hypothetical protein